MSNTRFALHLVALAVTAFLGGFSLCMQIRSVDSASRAQVYTSCGRVIGVDIITERGSLLRADAPKTSANCAGPVEVVGYDVRPVRDREQGAQ